VRRVRNHLGIERLRRGLSRAQVARELKLTAMRCSQIEHLVFVSKKTRDNYLLAIEAAAARRERERK
jgi:hypothetical protein